MGEIAHTLPSTQQGMSWAEGAGIARKNRQKVAKVKAGEQTGFVSRSTGETVCWFCAFSQDDEF